MSFDPNNVPLEYLLQPELLNTKDLLNILKARYVRVDNMEHLTKDELLNIFYRLITPKEQRTNRRSTGLNSEQNENVNKKFKTMNVDAFTDKTSQCTQKPEVFNGKTKSICETNGHVNTVSKIHLKRNYTNSEVKNEEPIVKKTRQRICWP